MECHFLKGFLVLLLMRQCVSEDIPIAEDAQELSQEAKPLPAEVVPVVAPFSLQDVRQAVQEASDVEGRGAEEVLKELLERVVEAALGQAEGGGEGSQYETAVQEPVAEDTPKAEKGQSERDTKGEMLKEAGGLDDTPKEGITVVKQEQDLAELDASEDAAEGGKGVLERGTASVEATEGMVTEGGETTDAEIAGKSPDSKDGQTIAGETVVAAEESAGNTAIVDNGVEDNGVEIVWSEEKGTPDADVEKTVDVIDGAGKEIEQEARVDSIPGVGVADVELIEETGKLGETLPEEGQVEGVETLIPSSDSYEIETTQAVVEEPPKEEEVSAVTEPVGEVESEQGYLMVEEGVARESAGGETEGPDVGEQAGESEIQQGSEPLDAEGAQQQVGEEESSETSLKNQNGSHELVVIAAPEPEAGARAPAEQSPDKASSSRSSSDQARAEDGTVGVEGADRGNEIIISVDDLAPHDTDAAPSTPEDFVKDAEPVAPQAEMGGLSEANELVEDAGVSDSSEPSLEAWKIGAICAAVFLVLETLIIIVYMVKCHNRNSSPQWSCEEGCVEPEPATGGNCRDDTLPAGDGDTKQLAEPDPSDVPQNTEQQKEEQAITMPNLPPSSSEESADAGPDASQELRTAML